MIIFLIGPKGSGKSTLRIHLEGLGYKSVSIEKIYDELDKNRISHTENHSSNLADEVFKIAEEQALIGYPKVVYDGTGRSKYFSKLYSNVVKQVENHRVIFIDIKKETAWARAQQRSSVHQRPFTREYFDKNYGEVQIRRFIANYILDNNGTKEDLINNFESILKNFI